MQVGQFFMKKEKEHPLRVLFVAAEAYPYASVGGLGMVMYSLPKALREIGIDARVFIPKYALIDEEKFPLKTIHQGLRVPTDDRKTPELICNVKFYQPEGETPIYFLENQEYYEKRANVYGYSDDPTRFALLSRGILEFLKESDWQPDIINCSDWQTGFLPNYLKTLYQKTNLSKIKTVFSIHNLYHQGTTDHHFVSEMDFDDGKSPIAPFFSSRLAKQNFMKRGIIYSDKITVVSETYAQEILTKEYGEGLEELLRELRTKIFGIINGLDYKSFNPDTDKNIISNYTYKDLKKRLPNKIHLQKEFNLDVNENIPMLGMVGRLDDQKGIDLLFPILEILIREFSVELVVVGGGSGKYRAFFEDLAHRFPKKVGCHLTPDFTLPRHIFSGSDIFLIPSKFEPCGITQMEAMRYGSIPVVRKTGGLADTVKNFNPQNNEGIGFVFEEFNSYSCLSAIIRALETFKYKEAWHKLIQRAMIQDFSWQASAKKYLWLYHKLVD
ncbi:MAG TPA: glycogen synthase [Candidatus Portnoybacteria bacterium]|nr:glycogen synthase [Candidatus Portnoybacteria bacterium]